MSPDTYTVLFGRIIDLELVYKCLADRVSVIEEQSIVNRNMVEEINDFKDKTNDRLDKLEKEQ